MIGMKSQQGKPKRTLLKEKTTKNKTELIRVALNGEIVVVKKDAELACLTKTVLDDKMNGLAGVLLFHPHLL